MNLHDFGYLRVAAAIPHLRVGDVQYNVEQISKLAHKAETQGADIICFPELSLTGYTCQDLFFSQSLQRLAIEGLEQLATAHGQNSSLWIVGAPLVIEGALYNCAIVIDGMGIAAVWPKIYLPNNGEFYEKRWFQSGAQLAEAPGLTPWCEATPYQLLDFHGVKLGIELCEDLWTPCPPSTQLCIEGAEVIFNLSGSNELIQKQQYRRQLVSQQSARTNSAYVYCSCGYGESTQDLVFAGVALIAENGSLLCESERFSRNEQFIIQDIDLDRLRAERLHNSNFTAMRNGDYNIVPVGTDELATELSQTLLRTYSHTPFVPPVDQRAERCREILQIQASGLAKRWEHTHAETLVLGISGGLDSTLALLVCVAAADWLGYDRQRIVGVTMPGFGTTDRTYQNALDLMTALGITQREINIREACMQHMAAIGHDPEVHDVTYENTQARERTQILMDLSNQLHGFVVGTGDLSELALGWATYNADQMSMYGVNAGVPKTLVRYLVETEAERLGGEAERILRDVLDTPVSPELLPADNEGKIAQKTEDLVGPYELHDFFLYYYLRFGYSKAKIRFLAQHTFQGAYSDEVINKWLDTFFRRFFQQQYKRSCMPDGPKVGSVNLSPRGDWRMPSDAINFEG